MLFAFDIKQGRFLSDFLNEFENACAARGIPLSSYGVMLQRNLVGRALKLFNSMKGQILPYQDIKLKLLLAVKGGEKSMLVSKLDNIELTALQLSPRKGVF